MFLLHAYVHWSPGKKKPEKLQREKKEKTPKMTQEKKDNENVLLHGEQKQKNTQEKKLHIHIYTYVYTLCIRSICIYMLLMYACDGM